MVGVVAVVGYNWFDGLCVCGFVVAEVAGSSGFPMSFFFFFNMGFCFGEILVSSGQWWLGFFWVFVMMGFCSVGFFWVDH